jgi:hypothetical protein
MKISNLLLYTLIIGCCTAQAAPARRQPKGEKPKKELAISDARRKEVEQDILNQLVDLVKRRQQIESVEANNTESLKNAIQQLPVEAKEAVLIMLVDEMLAEKDRPFRAPQDYTQLDAFFHLASLLMSHDPELAEKLTPCIGERNPLTLHQQLKSCLLRTPKDVQEKLSPQDWRAKASLLLKIKQRMGEKGAAAKAN